jgi:hypothetical protein
MKIKRDLPFFYEFKGKGKFNAKPIFKLLYLRLIIPIKLIKKLEMKLDSVRVSYH